jgi:Domain of unknown function (DUF4184)
VPLTLFAHQAPLLPLKAWRPALFDGTALVISSMTPDLAYAFPYTVSRGHSGLGLLTICLPMTLILVFVIRRWVADVAFAQLGGRWRLSDYRVLATRRPHLIITVTSALIGAGSHIFIDAFTHDGRWAARALGWDKTILFHAAHRDFSFARSLQYFGHTVGSLVCIMMLWRIARTERLEVWYNSDAVIGARRFRLSPRGRVAFWATFASGVVGAAAIVTVQGVNFGSTFVLFWGVAVGVVAASLLPQTRPEPRMQFAGRQRT